MKRKTFRSFDSIRSEFYSINQSAILSMLPHSYILERQKVLYESEDFKRLKRYERAYFNGMADAHLQSMYSHLTWGFVYNGQYTEKLPYGPDFDQNLVEKSYHHYKGHPERPF